MESAQLNLARAGGVKTDRAVQATAAAMAGLTAVYLAWMLLSLGGAHTTTVVDDFGEFGASAVAAGLCLWAASTVAEDRRWGWRLLGLSALSWSLGQGVWTYLEVGRGQLEPFPSPADAGFLLAVPLAVAGVLQFLRGSGLTNARALIDGAIVAAAVFFLSWVLVLEPTLKSGGAGGFNTYLGLAYPAGDVVTLVIVITAVSRSRAFEWSLGCVALGLVAIAASDSFFLYLSSNQALSTNPVDTGWTAGFLLMGFGALLEMRGASAAEPDVRVGSARVLLPYVPLVGASLLAAAILIRGGTLTLVGVGTLFTMVGLVLLRQVVAVREVARLSAELARTVAALETRERDLSFQTLHDPLTQLGNRVLFRDRLDHALETGGRDPQALAIMFLDLDDFKDVNDRFGHDAGDRLLVAVGERVRACLRPGDTVARLGGDEFAVIMLGLAGREEVGGVVKRLLGAFSAPMDAAGDIRVGISIGVVVTSTDTPNPAADLLRRADVAMYSAKAAGKNQHAFFEESMMPAGGPVNLGR